MTEVNKLHTGRTQKMVHENKNDLGSTHICNLGPNISRKVTFHPFPLPQCCKFRKTFGFRTFLQVTTATTTLQEGEAGISHLSGNYCPRLNLGQNISRQVTFHPFPLPQCCKFRKTFGFWTFLQATTATTTLQEGEAGISHLSGNYCPRLCQSCKQEGGDESLGGGDDPERLHHSEDGHHRDGYHKLGRHTTGNYKVHTVNRDLGEVVGSNAKRYGLVGHRSNKRLEMEDGCGLKEMIVSLVGRC